MRVREREFESFVFFFSVLVRFFEAFLYVDSPWKSSAFKD
jgi:hypothetical protein